VYTKNYRLRNGELIQLPWSHLQTDLSRDLLNKKNRSWSFLFCAIQLFSFCITNKKSVLLFGFCIRYTILDK